MSHIEGETRFHEALRSLDTERLDILATLTKATERSNYLSEITRGSVEAFAIREGFTNSEAHDRRRTALRQLRHVKAQVREMQRRLAEIKIERREYLQEIGRLNAQKQSERFSDDRYAIEVVQELRLAVRDAFDAFEDCALTFEQKAALELMGRAAKNARTFVRLARGSGALDDGDADVLR